MFVGIEPVRFWTREVVWRKDGQIGRANWSPFTGLGPLSLPVPDKMGDPMVRRAAFSTAPLRGFMRWSVMPVARVKRERCRTRVTFGDARFSGGRLFGREIRDPFAFVQRGGLYDVGGGTPAPLAAIPATGRRWPAWDQRDLFAHVAGRLGIPGADPDALVTAIAADPRAWMSDHAERFIAEATTDFEPPHEPYPVGAA